MARGMSEDLTDLSEGELDGLVDTDAGAAGADEMEIDAVNGFGMRVGHGRISIGDFEVRRRVTRSRAGGAENKKEAEKKEDNEEHGGKEKQEKEKERTKAGRVKKRWRGFR